MTLNDLRASDKAFLIPKDVAEVLNCNPHYIRVKARDGTLPFPYIMTGCRTKIPRLPFIAWMEGPPGPEK